MIKERVKMGLALDITDTKGIKTRYHIIKSFEWQDCTLKIKLFSYVNQATRDAEKKAVEQNNRVKAWAEELNKKQAELDALVGNPDEAEKIALLADEINKMKLDENRPQPVEEVDRHYTEDEITLDYCGTPITLDLLYQKLAETGKYKGAKSI